MKQKLTFYVAAILCLLFSPFLLAQTENTYGNEWIDYAETYYKFKIEKAGVYKIPYSSLQNAGLADLDGTGFHLFAKGREIPIFVSNENAMTENDYIEFYAEANDGHFDTQLFAEPEWQLHTFESLFSDSLTYYLTWNDTTEGLRFAETENNLTELPAKESYFMHSTLKIHNNTFNHGKPFHIAGMTQYLPDFEDGEGFVGLSILGETSQTHTLKTPFKYTGTNAPLAAFESKIVGRSDDYSVIDDHHVQVKINGLVYQDISSGYQAYDNLLMETPVFLSNISAETEVEYISVGDQSSTDINAVSYTKLTYPRQFSFYEENKFFFTLENNEEKYLEIELFEGGNQPIVYDLTNNLRLLPVLEDDVYKIFLPAGDDISLKRILYIFNPDVFCELNCEFPCIPDCLICGTSACAAWEVKSLEETQFTDFAAAENQGSYIILTHPSLRNGETDYVQSYSDYRNSNEGGNHESIIVNVEELYDQFSMGIPKHPLAVRHFVNFAIDNWNISPEYLFLVGKSISYNVTGSTIYNKCLIPTFGRMDSDNALTIRNAQEHLPQLAVGRLSANTAADVALYFDKVLTYENQSECMTIDDIWKKNMIHISSGSNPSQTTDLNDYLDIYQNIIENGSFGGQVIKKFEQTGYNVEPQPQFPQYMNEGTGLISYFGHSEGYSAWRFDIDEPTVYTNGEKGIYPIIFSNSSYTGYIHEFNDNSLSFIENYVLAENAGAIAAIGNRTTGYPIYSSAYFTELYEQLAGENYGKGLGKSILQTIHNNFIEDENHVRYEGTKLTNACFTLQGDPAIVLAGSYEKADFLIHTETVKATLNGLSYTNFPIVFPESETEITIEFDVLNLGKTIDENITINIAMSLPDGTLVYSDEQSIEAPYYDTTVSFVLPLEATTELYDVAVFIDQNDEIDELCEENNSFSFQMTSTLNTPPQANNANVEVLEDNELSIFVLENTSDAENDMINIEFYTSPNNGTLTQIDNELVYVPNENYFGTDTFFYTVTDGIFSTTATIIINVLSVNDAPEATNISRTLSEDSETTINISDYTSDIDNDILNIESFTLPNNGTVTEINNELVYVPNENYFGTDTFIYTVTDGEFSATATVNVNIMAVNDAPQADNTAFEILEDSELSIFVLENVSDVENDVIIFDSYTFPTNGTIVQIGTELVYTPNINFFGTDEFTYTVTDGELSNEITIIITVLPVNDAPQANNMTLEVWEDTETAINVLEYVTNVDNDVVNLASFTPPNNGTMTQIGNELVYEPNENYVGTDEFTYTVTDGELSTTATISITILWVNDAPTAPIFTSPQQNLQIESWEENLLFEWTSSLDIECVNEPTYDLFLSNENGLLVLFNADLFSEFANNSFEITDVSILEHNMTYEYYIVATDCEGATATSEIFSFTTPPFAVAISDVSENEFFALYQNYPNPFAEKTTFSFFLPKKTNVEFSIYNFLGQKVTTVLSETKTKGKHQVSFSSENLANGIYFYELKTDEMSVSKRMMILK
ncbi:MAG: tandem-95 repeat protein [Chitinophagales bacterium]